MSILNTLVSALIGRKSPEKFGDTEKLGDDSPRPEIILKVDQEKAKILLKRLELDFISLEPVICKALGAQNTHDLQNGINQVKAIALRLRNLASNDTAADYLLKSKKILEAGTRMEQILTSYQAGEIAWNEVVLRISDETRMFKKLVDLR
ncbi:MAG TPA: hypothetical protein VJJ82_05455 [Candidatus Nanoarchaeia archaeon]|nr:hypothetical protein [Candidatus Nanoarchaeia archaeon]